MKKDDKILYGLLAVIGVYFAWQFYFRKEKITKIEVQDAEDVVGAVEIV